MCKSLCDLSVLDACIFIVLFIFICYMGEIYIIEWKRKKKKKSWINETAILNSSSQKRVARGAVLIGTEIFRSGGVMNRQTNVHPG